jgi:NAD(P)-dependent dehydrogenase (short-subunit alcohol dehydrogenase family)
MFDLSEKVILVVGGRGHLGRDFCRKLHDQGARVISADLPIDSKTGKRDEKRHEDDEIEQVGVDVSERASISSVVDQIIRKHQKIDVLVFAATTKPKDFYLPFLECSLEGWKAVTRVEMDGLFLVAQEVGKIMEKNQTGSMIFLSSIYGVVGNDQRIYAGANLQEVHGSGPVDGEAKQLYSHVAYAAVKGSIISMTRFLAAYWGDKNIRVNCISPGGVQHEGENETFLEKYAQKVPLGRKAKAHEISASVVFLASDDASYVTGQNIIVDGGWTAW